MPEDNGVIHVKNQEEEKVIEQLEEPVTPTEEPEEPEEHLSEDSKEEEV